MLNVLTFTVIHLLHRVNPKSCGLKTPGVCNYYATLLARDRTNRILYTFTEQWHGNTIS